METEDIKILGIGSFFLAAIPAVLAGAALMWLAFYTGVIDWQKTQRVEGRMEGRVGVNVRLDAPVDLLIKNKSCLNIDRAFFDDDKITIYMMNQCHQSIDYYEWHWKAIAPDGTIIEDGYDNSLGVIDRGEKVEKTIKAPNDTRIAQIVVWSNYE